MQTIADLTLSCLEHLHKIHAMSKRPPYLHHYASFVSPTIWKDLIDALYVWTMNTGADQTGTISIESRFRNPTVLPKSIQEQLWDLEVLLRAFVRDFVVQGTDGEGKRRGERMVREGCLGNVRETWNEVALTLSSLRQFEHAVPKLADMGRTSGRGERG